MGSESVHIFKEEKKKMEVMDMNCDCLEHWIKLCDVDSLVAVSQTCKKLQTLATPLFKCKTSYVCDINTEEDEMRVKRTIGAIESYLIGLDLRTSHYWRLKNAFVGRLPGKCPNLRKLEIHSRVSPNVIFDCIDTLQQLEHLTIHCWDEQSGDIAESAIGVARNLKQLRLLKVFGAEWDHGSVINFLREAENLDEFGFDMNLSKRRRSHYEICKVFLEGFRSLCISNPSELHFFLEFREVLQTI